MWNGRWGQQENKKDTLLISLEILWSFILRCPMTIARFSDEVAFMIVFVLALSTSSFQVNAESYIDVPGGSREVEVMRRLVFPYGLDCNWICKKVRKLHSLSPSIL